MSNGTLKNTLSELVARELNSFEEVHFQEDRLRRFCSCKSICFLVFKLPKVIIESYRKSLS